MCLKTCGVHIVSRVHVLCYVCHVACGALCMLCVLCVCVSPVLCVMCCVHKPNGHEACLTYLRAEIRKPCCLDASPTRPPYTHTFLHEPEFPWYRSSSPHIGVKSFRTHLMAATNTKGRAHQIRLTSRKRKTPKTNFLWISGG